MEEPAAQAGGDAEVGGPIVPAEQPPQKRRRRRKPAQWLDAQTQIPGDEYNNDPSLLRPQAVDYRRPLPHESPLFGLTTTIASIAPNIMWPFLAAPVLGDRRRAAMAGIAPASAIPHRTDLGSPGDEQMAPVDVAPIAVVEPGSGNTAAEAGPSPGLIPDPSSLVDWQQQQQQQLQLQRQQQLDDASAAGPLAGQPHPHADAGVSTSTDIHGTELPPLELPFQESHHPSPLAPPSGGNDMDLGQVPQDTAAVSRK